MTPRSQKYFFDKYIERITYVPPILWWLCEDCKPVGYCQSSKDDTQIETCDELELAKTVKEDTVEEEKGIILKSLRDILPYVKAHKDDMVRNAENRMHAENENAE